jgi:DNA invertase Pin-like site-specific DNA recombinase
MKLFLVLNSDQDGDVWSTLERFEVEADTRQEALEKALSELGWYVVQDDADEEEEL